MKTAVPLLATPRNTSREGTDSACRAYLFESPAAARERQGGRALSPIVNGLRAAKMTVENLPGIAETVSCLDNERPTLAVVELRPGDPGGFCVLEALLRRWPGLTVFACSERPTVAEAVHVVRAGAAWYGASPGGPDFERALQAALDGPNAATLPAERRGRALGQGSRIVGSSPAISRILQQSALVAPTRTTVLILGETGTGKERLAQAIHEGSPRRQAPFVAVNCAALAEGLLESELFGHEKGAFSGANARREGRFQSADGGTLFLDEIGEVTLTTQVKLLRVLQERKFERVGGNQTLSVDVRIIAATNRNLREMVEEKTFRADLFYRLNVMTIDLPPLRDRREDIPLLVAHLVPRLAVELGLPEGPITPAAMDELCAYDWPGNVRELENALQRALVISGGAPIEHFDLRPSRKPTAVAAGISIPSPMVPGASFREIERHAIMATYEACGRSPVRTAEVLGISPRTVHYRLREYRGDRGRRIPRGDADGALGTNTPLHVLHSDARAADGEAVKH